MLRAAHIQLSCKQANMSTCTLAQPHTRTHMQEGVRTSESSMANLNGYVCETNLSRFKALNFTAPTSAAANEAAHSGLASTSSQLGGRFVSKVRTDMVWGHQDQHIVRIHARRAQNQGQFLKNYVRYLMGWISARPDFQFVRSRSSSRLFDSTGDQEDSA